MCYRLFISKKKWTDNYKNQKKSKQTRGRASPSQSFIWELPWGILCTTEVRVPYYSHKSAKSVERNRNVLVH